MPVQTNSGNHTVTISVISLVLFSSEHTCFVHTPSDKTLCSIAIHSMLSASFLASTAMGCSWLSANFILFSRSRS